MFTEAELKTIESHKDDFSKVTYKALKAIKEKYDASERENKDCGCSMGKRKIWITNFYEWYEKQVVH